MRTAAYIQAFPPPQETPILYTPLREVPDPVILQDGRPDPEARVWSLDELLRYLRRDSLDPFTRLPLRVDQIEPVVWPHLPPADFLRTLQRLVEADPSWDRFAALRADMDRLPPASTKEELRRVLASVTPLIPHIPAYPIRKLSTLFRPVHVRGDDHHVYELQDIVDTALLSVRDPMEEDATLLSSVTGSRLSLHDDLRPAAPFNTRPYVRAMIALLSYGQHPPADGYGYNDMDMCRMYRQDLLSEDPAYAPPSQLSPRVRAIRAAVGAAHPCTQELIRYERERRAVVAFDARWEPPPQQQQVVVIDGVTISSSSSRREPSPLPPAVHALVDRFIAVRTAACVAVWGGDRVFCFRCQRLDGALYSIVRNMNDLPGLPLDTLYGDLRELLRARLPRAMRPQSAHHEGVYVLNCIMMPTDGAHLADHEPFMDAEEDRQILNAPSVAAAPFYFCLGQFPEAPI